ncbi:MAG: TolC family outer membrane protein [Azoarcus sp.]|nr:TolC family outer membrane protein [Azoarcus sp.]
MRVHLSLPAIAIMGAGMLSALPPAHADNLLGLYREAVQGDPNYLAARADTQASREVAPQSLARLLPNVSFSGNRMKHSATQKEDVPPFGKVSVPFNYDTRYHVLGLTQPLFRAGSYAAWKQSRALVEGAEADLQWAEQRIGTRVSSAYFKVLLAEANLEVTKAQRDAYLAQLDYAQKAFQTGSGTRTDIDEARAQLDMAAAQTIELHYQLNYAQDALKAIIDRPLTPLARLKPERMQLVRPDPDQLEVWVRKAEEVNPRLHALRSSIEAADFNVKKAMSGHLPTLDFVAQRTWSENQAMEGQNREYKFNDKQYGLRFEVPIFSGGDTVSQVRQARAELDRAQQQLEEGRREIDLLVREKFNGVAQGVLWVRAYEQAVKSAEQGLESTRKGFKGGTRTTLDILIAEQNLANAKRDLNRGRFDYVLSRLDLLSLVGELNEAEIGRFNGWLEERTE